MVDVKCLCCTDHWGRFPFHLRLNVVVLRLPVSGAFDHYCMCWVEGLGIFIFAVGVFLLCYLGVHRLASVCFSFSLLRFIPGV